jgi:hypothetical protein
LQRAYDFCLGEEARAKANECTAFARRTLANDAEHFYRDFR